jgi:hypothetical protein
MLLLRKTWLERTQPTLLGMCETPEKGSLRTPRSSPAEGKNLPLRTSRPGTEVRRLVRPDIDRFAHSADVQNLVGLCLWAGLVDVQTRPVVAVVTMCKNPDRPNLELRKPGAAPPRLELGGGWEWWDRDGGDWALAGRGRKSSAGRSLSRLRHTVQEVFA